jgi:hypothetical protein
MSAYQEKVLAFIGDCRATKEPTPVCLPTTKSWEWHTGDAVTDFARLAEYYERSKNKGTLWMPRATDGATAAIQVPNLLAIPNALVDLLRNQGAAIMPYNVLATIDSYLQEGRAPAEQEGEHVRNWCLVASQAGANGKSKVFLETSPVTIDEEDFNKWVVNRLSTIRKVTPHQPTIEAKGNGGPAINDGTKGINSWWRSDQKISIITTHSTTAPAKVEKNQQMRRSKGVDIANQKNRRLNNKKRLL